jgi:hypothetical protein
MVKPPGNFGGAGVFEVDDGVFLAVELPFVEQGSGTVDQAGKSKIGIATNPFTVEAGKQRGGGGSVKTFVVIEDPYSQRMPQSPTGFPPAENHADGVGLAVG